MIFSFVNKIRRKARDVKTIAELCNGAEEFSRRNGVEKPGIEHYFLSCILLSDGEARSVLSEFNVSADSFEKAIQLQHEEALSKVGISSEDLENIEFGINGEKPILYRTQPSGGEFIKELYKDNHSRCFPLNSIAILETLVKTEHGVVKRTLNVLGVDLDALREAISKRIEIAKSA